jgi:CDP-6-deoxy-D-xylo-4-hexulose-3-dehydrase
MGAVQLPKLDHFNDLRRKAASYLLQQLAPYEEYFHFQQETPKGKHVWFGFSLIVKETSPFSLKDVTTYLQRHGIESRPIIAGNMTRHPGVQLYPHRISGELIGADTVMKRGLSFGCHHGTDLTACKYIVAVFEAFIAEYVHGVTAQRLLA